MRVLALVPYPTGRAPGQRYRIEQWAGLLRKDAIEVTFAPFLSESGMEVIYEKGRTLSKAAATLRGYARRVGHRLRRQAFDVAYVYREVALLAPAWVERLLTIGLPLVYDFDDAIYLPDASAANAWMRHLKTRRKTEELCRRARHVTVGNAVLAEFARAQGPPVTIVPSTIDTDVYRVEPRSPGAKPLVGWTGSTTTLRHLLEIAPALRQLRRRIDFELRVIGGEVRLEGLDVRCIPWRAESETDDLRLIDVGLMPLPDDEWSRGKCGMKALQYMALGIPPVVSPVGANATIVADGVNGFHARTEAEWVERLATLIEHPALRARLGAAARRTVEDSYSARVHAPRMGAVLREAAR